jgi:predicted transglutaminase-like cysteine proteinase
MGAQTKHTFKLSAAASIVLFTLLGYPSAGTARVFALNMTIGESTAPPDGWFQFCADYESECKVEPSEPKEVALSKHAWKELIRINSWVNNHIKPMSDMAHWGVLDRWSYPDDGYGDCEDYALLKRRMLMQAGWPREALLMTVVRDQNGEGHAVLTVKTDKGEFILDNQREGVLLWSETGYEFLSRQSQSDPNKWVWLYESAGKTRIAAAERAERNDANIKQQDQKQIVVSLDEPRVDRTAPADNFHMASSNALIDTAFDLRQSLIAFSAINVTATDKIAEKTEQKAIPPGWAVQLIGNSSEATALASYQQMQKAYNGILGSRQPVVIKTNVGVGSYWYRVRIAAGSRGAAEELCSGLKALGGSCLVQPD